MPGREAAGGDAASSGYGVRPPGYRLPETTALGRVQLQVADLSRSLAFYRDLLGFEAREEGRRARLAGRGGPELVELIERPGARPVPAGGRPGLFHAAVLLPARAELGRFLRHLVGAGVHPGVADHWVSEALYLSDPDGLGLEVYADRPRASWRIRGDELAMATDALDVADLVRSGGERAWQGMPGGARIGHVHLHVGDLDRAAHFYHEALGLDRVVWSYPGALFLSAGGYHHHVGTNTWARSERPAGEDEARLLSWRLALPDEADVRAAGESLRGHGYGPLAGGPGARFEDPWGTVVELAAASRDPAG